MKAVGYSVQEIFGHSMPVPEMDMIDGDPGGDYRITGHIAKPVRAVPEGWRIV
jgi:hypothetical protein